ncbi:MAG TPA: N-acetylmuramoyl-L-alanine amidase [Candidatus Accumulibacter phosphatis]|nr:N-acetylmuramyl-L-alanine amidase [Accumulibacter sp.]HCV12122.1 N-acetylmuramyl-L-alanine amidase [Accumulibacter sp.]HRL77411.1 N-acetylmuramoyl-L-alanine amidase [Candidatus Accumulibacter phosphatis]HRQ97625.1 N-acetylmuramoyl-L-alanine amidase [Candidatus Accumulibacter phosphatis]
MTLRIENHKLVGDQVSHRDTPNRGGAMSPSYLVLHYTAGRSLESSVESLCTRKPQGNASAHIVLGRDGRIVQLAPFNIVTWHAGVSQWAGLVGLNSHSIGVEMDNAGLLKRIGSQYQAWFGKAYPEDEVLLAAHRNGGPVSPWHTYSEVQIERAIELADLLVEHYGLKDVLGHEDIAPGRKSDPGPAFPLSALKSRVLGREDDSPPRYVVTASNLNIRKGPDASFEPVAAALKKGTDVFLLEARDRWSLVEVVSNAEVEGWVSNSFIAAAAAPRSAAASSIAAAADAGPTGSRSAAAADKAVSPKKARQAKKHRPAKDV